MCVKKKKEENHVSNENVFKSMDDYDFQLTTRKIWLHFYDLLHEILFLSGKL